MDVFSHFCFSPIIHISKERHLIIQVFLMKFANCTVRKIARYIFFVSNLYDATNIPVVT